MKCIKTIEQDSAFLEEHLMATKFGSLSQSDLLEMIITLITPYKDAKPLVKNLLSEFSTIGNVISAKPQSLSLIPGIDPTTRNLFRLLHELIAIVTKEQIINKINLSTNTKLIKHLRTMIGYSQIEQFIVLFLDSKFSLIAEDLHDCGTIDSVALYPREVTKNAIYHSAKYVILSHNHPSGITRPSHTDAALTESVARALLLIDAKLVDHIIISPTSHYSFKQHHLL